MKILNKRGRLACFFTIVSICFSIYQNRFPHSLQVPAWSFQAYAHPDSFDEVLNVPEAFGPDYEEMERNFKIFVYPHNITLCDDEYANEGLFYLNLDQTHFWTKDPEKAQLFLIPFSCYSSPAGGKSDDERAISVEDFVKSLVSKYPYWNRTLGTDHFFITCADIHVTSTARIVNLMKNSIRVMCSPSYDVEYVPHKDVSLPQHVPSFALPAAGNIINDRTVLAFWRGPNDSYVREKLLNSWENYPGLLIKKGKKHSLEEQDASYHEAFKISKFCICPAGPELDRIIALAIHYGCVPVILSNYYDLPFTDILDWRTFSIILKESVVYHLKELLEVIGEPKYRALHTNTVRVRKHFQWNLPPVRHDAFHMTMYELWMRNHVTKYY